ncbi:MFS transporter [Fodinicola feengrottensis]|uniref:MFS transporter n=1 Tax=Fodinicola feengrottensis TaxID=435914 RepID=A0ABP4RXB0_9ACTN
MTEQRSLWRDRDFTILLGGQLASYVGDQAQGLAMPLLVLAVTGSVTEAGVVLALQTVSFLVFGLLAGALADRWNRKITMIWCELGRLVLAASVPVALWLGWLSFGQLCAVAVFSGILSTLFEVANTAALPNVVGADRLTAALGYSQSAANTVRIAGATVAGILYGLGRAVPFVVNAVSYAVSAVSLSLMRADFQQKRTEVRPRLGSEIAAGLRWIGHHRVIRFLTVIVGLDNIRYGAGYLLIIVLAQHLGGTPFQIGLIFSAAGIGSVLGALACARATEMFPVGRIAIVMLWLEALMFPFYALSPNVLSLGIVAALESVVAPIYTVAMTSYRLSITPDELRGRTTSAVQTVTTGALSLGTLLGSTLIGWIGAATATYFFGGWLAVLAIVTTANRAVRQTVTAPAGEAAPTRS